VAVITQYLHASHPLSSWPHQVESESPNGIITVVVVVVIIIIIIIKKRRRRKMR